MKNCKTLEMLSGIITNSTPYISTFNAAGRAVACHCALGTANRQQQYYRGVAEHSQTFYHPAMSTAEIEC